MMKTSPKRASEKNTKTAAKPVSKSRAAEMVETLRGKKPPKKIVTNSPQAMDDSVAAGVEHVRKALGDDVETKKVEAAAEPGDTKTPEEVTDNHLLGGVLMQCTLHSSIGQCAAKEPSRYAIDSVLVLRDSPINAGATREPVSKKCAYVATDGRMLACSFGTMLEREASSYKELWTRLPAEYCNIGKKSRVISLASSPDQGLFGLERAWCMDGCHCAPVAEGFFPNIVDVLPEIDPENSVILAINVEMLANLAKALNAVTDEDGGKIVRLMLPRDLKSTTKLVTAIPAVGSAGIGIIMPCEIEDSDGYIEKYNADRAEVLRMHRGLPEEARRAPREDPDESLASAGSANAAGGAGAISAAGGDPWLPAWLATSVEALGLSFALTERLLGAGVRTIADIQELNKKPKGLCTIKGMGAAKADTVGEATNKRWKELRLAHESAFKPAPTTDANEPGGTADTNAIAEESKTATAGIGGAA